MSSGIRNLREALPADERHAVDSGSDFWDDPKVSFEYPSRTPEEQPIDDIVRRLRDLPPADQGKAVAAVEKVLDDEYYLLRSKGPSDTPTYVRREE